MDNISRKKLLKTCQTGDVLLYNSQTIFGRIIEYVTYSKFSHAAIIVRDPIYIDPSLNGVFIVEAGEEKIPDVISKKKICGVQLIPLEYVLDTYENGYIGNLYYRKLNCKRDETFHKNIDGLIKKKDGCPYDLCISDWLLAKFNIKIGKSQYTNRFWCSALVAYIYVELSLLDKNLPWSMIAPRQFSYYENDKLSFINCDLDPEKKVIYKN